MRRSNRQRSCVEPPAVTSERQPNIGPSTTSLSRCLIRAASLGAKRRYAKATPEQEQALEHAVESGPRSKRARPGRRSWGGLKAPWSMLPSTSSATTTCVAPRGVRSERFPVRGSCGAGRLSWHAARRIVITMMTRRWQRPSPLQRLELKPRSTHSRRRRSVVAENVALDISLTPCPLDHPSNA